MKTKVYLWPYFIGPQKITMSAFRRPCGVGDPIRRDIMPLCVDMETAIAFVGAKQMPINGAN